jgi:hypothetical protein
MQGCVQGYLPTCRDVCRDTCPHAGIPAYMQGCVQGYLPTCRDTCPHAGMCAGIPSHMQGYVLGRCQQHQHTHLHKGTYQNTHTHTCRNEFLAVVTYLVGTIVMYWHPREARQLHAVAFAFFYFQLLNIVSVNRCTRVLFSHTCAFVRRIKIERCGK